MVVDCAGTNWYDDYGLHASANLVNAGNIVTPAEASILFVQWCAILVLRGTVAFMHACTANSHCLCPLCQTCCTIILNIFVHVFKHRYVWYANTIMM